MKKKFLVAGACLFSAVMAAAFVGCSGKGAKSGALSSNDAYGLGAVSTVKLLGGVSGSAVKTLSALSKNLPDAADGAGSGAEDTVKAQAEKFNEYFTALDSFLGDDLVTTATEKNTDTQYPYDTKMTISGKNFDGETETYVMYYTETLAKTETDDKDGETESEYTLTGVMVVDGADYALEGKRSEETERDESESELEIRAYADVSDKTTYVKMEQEYSEERGESETEYVYSVYSNGALVEKTAVEFEKENKGGKSETEYELEFLSGDGRGRYSVEREIKNGRTEIEVKYDIGGKTGKFVIAEITGDNGRKSYEYTFDDGDKRVF